MRLTLLSFSSLCHTTLPEKCSGLYHVHSREMNGKIIPIMVVQGVPRINDIETEHWVLKSNSHYALVGMDGKEIPEIKLEGSQLYAIRCLDDGRVFVLFTEEITADRTCFSVYKISGNNVHLTIGRKDCDIVYNSPYVANTHAVISYGEGGVTIADNKTENGTYVNGVRVGNKNLSVGDTIFILGLTIVVSGAYVFINNPDSRVLVSKSKMKRYTPDPYRREKQTIEENELEDNDYYYRTPRFKQEVDPLDIALDPPPAPQKADDTPALLAVGPSVTMGLSSATMAAYSLINASTTGNYAAAIPTMVMSAGMLAGTLLWPSLNRSRQKKLRADREYIRRKAYKEYLEKMGGEVVENIARQEKRKRENDVTTVEYLARYDHSNPVFWDRTPKHSDFLRIRLGNGTMLPEGTIRYPERHFSIEQDDLMEAMYRFAEEEYRLQNVPICLPLKERYVTGIYASHDLLIQYAKMLLIQLVTLHSYDEVKLVILYDKRDERELSFVRWLPHIMDNEKRIRYLATSTEEAKVLSMDLEPIINERQNLNEDELKTEIPHYVVVCLDRYLADKAEILQTIQKSKKYLGFTVIAMYEHLKDLPVECSAIVSIKNDLSGQMILLDDICDNPIPFLCDDLYDINMDKMVRILANTQVDTGATEYQLPSRYTFMEMMDVGMVEHLNLLERWKNNDPTKSLAAPIGVDRFGEHFLLDLHEKAHGPHGLIAGMTGSGKSETIMAYILSMAISYHPYEVAFILIDYKGGGMAEAFKNIPHTAGIITNLDGNMINRSLVSLQSEIERRQRIFKEVSLKNNISNIDIYKYQKLFRENKVVEPLPHLIIISDEFAELKKDQPEFMASLTSTARVGRSLGVHLILATQKPGGVVDEQIRSNSRFRLSLKVQDRSDSQEMLGRPEAANLRETGRFFLQVGNNEIFSIGQSAWAGAAYYPAATVVKDKEDAVSIIDANGRMIAEMNIDEHADVKDPQKQLDVITEYIRAVSEEECIQRWKMWLDPIPAHIYVDELRIKYAVSKRNRYVLEPVIGEYDDPKKQRQDVLTMPITEEGNAIIYGAAGSGKEMLMDAICYSLITQHSAEEINLYLLDFASQGLTAFARAPQVGDVVLAHEKEKVVNLIKLLNAKLEERKKLFASFGGSLEKYNAKARFPEANIVIMINGYAAFAEINDDCLSDMIGLLREGSAYGIYFILGCTGTTDVKYNLLQYFKGVYCLQLNKASDYSSVMGNNRGMIPSNMKGRGLIRKGELYEFQTAEITQNDSVYQFIQSLCMRLRDSYHGKSADAIPILPTTVTEEFLRPYVEGGNLARVPVGVEKDSLKISFMELASRPVHVILGEEEAITDFVEALARMFAVCYHVDTMLFTEGEHGEDLSCVNLQTYSGGAEYMKGVLRVFNVVLQRHNAYVTAIEEGTLPPVFEPMVVLINSFEQLKAGLPNKMEFAQTDDDTPLNRLDLAIEKCTKEYKVFFIVASSREMSAGVGMSWYKKQIQGNNGIWLGNGIGSQYRLTIGKKPDGFHSMIPEHFGYMIRNTAATLVKFLQ